METKRSNLLNFVFVVTSECKYAKRLYVLRKI
jgi:hypothetical protein